MRALFISAAMFAAIGGTALAQASDPAAASAGQPVNPPAASSTDTSSQGSMSQGMSAQGASSQGSMSSGAATAAPPAATDSSTSAMPNANSSASDTSAQSTTTADTPAPPSGDYPVCKTRAQDHCRVAKHHAR